MVPPLIGLGHSMGGAQLIYLSLMHPRLLHGLVMIEPIVYDVPPALDKYGPVHGAANRRDSWPTEQHATADIKQSKLHKKWDQRVQDLWIKYSLRRLPGSDEVVSATTKDQEVFSYTRPTYISSPNPAHLKILEKSDILPNLDRTLLESSKTPFCRPEPLVIFDQLPSLRPAVLYIFGKNSSFLTQPGLHTRLRQRTGIGALGSGGFATDRVADVYIDDVGHLLPMENPKRVAQVSSEWIIQEIEVWSKEQRNIEREWDGKQGKERRSLDQDFLRALAVSKCKGNL